ncbi:trafficking protein particle complex subunit, putative [Entamoeba invadens IP1]|uniref:Trafficking protein particle complex subunit, putative n=1 Tax=Entamoeba invadens IP1 TaxID=370355 RepID=A0A0A1UF30_ENTIV|nr:trafficking protein particle complex subunit, putative [Entamoeba invadens IP1]ELP95216.1 trafficking protein particle complex subunit, putative [Entamoeba invadens IP1]|eukprot:XP_004261987.1 trafficking protein particle complex subunit, putative [Entamoeba invadens IP1]
MSKNSDKGLTKTIPQVSLSAFSFLFGEYIHHEFHQENRITTTQFHDKLFDLGYNLGMRMTELISYKEKEGLRENTTDGVMNFLAKDMWRVVFGYQVNYGKVRDKANEFLITDKNLIITEYISYASDCNVYCVAFVAGIAQSCMDAADFKGTVTHGEDEDGPYLHIIFQL